MRTLSKHAREPEAALHADRMRAIALTLEGSLAIARAGLESVRAEADMRLGRQRERIGTSEKAARQATDLERLNLVEKVQARSDEQTWTADTMYESMEPVPSAQFEAFKKATDEGTAVVTRQVSEALDLLARARVACPIGESVREDLPESVDADPQAALAEQGRLVEAVNAALRRQMVARLLRVGLVHATAFVTITALSGIAGWFLWSRETNEVAVSLGAGALVALVVLSVGWVWAGSRLSRIAQPLSGARAIASVISKRALSQAETRRASLQAEYRAQHTRDRAAARHSIDPAAKEIELLYARKIQLMSENAGTLRTSAKAQHDLACEAAETRCTQECATAHAAHNSGSMAESRRHESRLNEITRVEQTHLTALRDAWHRGQRQIVDDTQALLAIDQSLFARWSDPAWRTFLGRAALTGAAKVGAVTVNLREIPGALPTEPELAWPAGAARLFHLPVVLSLPRDASLFIDAPRDGRAAGLAVLQEAMLRILVAIPPGLARFTIADPIGLGEGFAAFMHLTDDAEHLIGERIWTDARHIEQRLGDLCQHMETVIQKFLRNEYASLDEYNRQAGEIAEPYRFLVLCDFPANISEVAARHLASVINSGPRCGVFTLILRDVAESIPAPLTEAEMRAGGLHLAWRDGHFWVDHEWLGRFPLSTAPAPSRDETIALLRRIGAAARASKRVEVPFASIAPEDSAVWTESTAEGITVPIGRSGATRLQAIHLGTGTSQHALIAGKTGSGKSTLFHALITNLALRFSPDEAELWLIDFKKGVEFRTYATNALPHARVVAIESDREFGLSVLRGLDAELRRRGEVFRAQGVQDLAGYRRSKAAEIIPRTLLIIDEFQELFTEDDKVSEESALLLDRLVRQGRAFGMHVILGSQTLGGAYSIARATMGQMAVRVALQCNEADSQLILSDDNLAGRLLSRPGDAIYNDSGGLIEGNNPFQVVWLPDEERDRMLARVRRQQIATPPVRRPTMIVFEGNAPAHMHANRLMMAARSRRELPALPEPTRLWLGDAISIKDPTSVVLSRQTGANVMVIGQREDAALALSASAMVSLAARFPKGRCRILLLDGTPPDSPDFGRLAALVSALGLDAMTGGHRDAEAILAAATHESVRRQQAHSTTDPTWLVLVHALHRFRALRRNEDDYSFSSSTSDAPPTADKLLGALLKDGPPLGIHVQVTCDGATNLARSFDRNAIREFEWRVLFQISATDSSTLIDSPVASRLGPMRALLHSEETGVQEKFRPYAWPDDGWISQTFS